MIAVIYGRVSTEEQFRSGFSLAEQLRACRERAEALTCGLQEPATLIEFTDDMSGELLERPGLQAALDLVRHQPVAYFICLDPDRLARRLMHQLLVTDEIERNRCRLEFVQHDYQETPEGRLFYQMRGAIAEFEKAKILERTARGQRGKVAAGGLPHGIQMYGYRFIKGAGKQARARVTMLPDPYEADWVRQIYHWCAGERVGPLAIARRLSDWGIPTKTGRGKWQHTQVRRILTHPTYATGLLALGKRDHRGIAVARRLTLKQRAEKGIVLTARAKPQAQWAYVEVEPLVDSDLWNTVQTVLDSFRVGHRRSGGRDRPRILSGLGRCGLCGERLYYLNGSKMVCSARYAKHWRTASPPAAECRLAAKPRAAIEEGVWQQVTQWLLTPERIQAELRVLEGETASPGSDDGAGAVEAERLTAELHRREGELERLGLLFARGLWPGDRALPAIEETNRQIQALHHRLATLGREPAPHPGSPQPSLELSSLPGPKLVAEVQATLETLPTVKKAELIRLAVRRFELLPSARGAPPKLTVFPASPGERTD